MLQISEVLFHVWRPCHCRSFLWGCSLCLRRFIMGSYFSRASEVRTEICSGRTIGVKVNGSPSVLSQRSPYQGDATPMSRSLSSSLIFVSSHVCRFAPKKMTTLSKIKIHTFPKLMCHFVFYIHTYTHLVNYFHHHQWDHDFLQSVVRKQLWHGLLLKVIIECFGLGLWLMVYERFLFYTWLFLWGLWRKNSFSVSECQPKPFHLS